MPDIADKERDIFYIYSKVTVWYTIEKKEEIGYGTEKNYYGL